MPRLKEKYFQAKKLREKGYSLKEISKKLSVSKSTASIWLSKMPLPPTALKRLEKRRLLGRLKASQTKQLKAKTKQELTLKKAERFVKSTPINERHLKLFCALLYECEGTKETRNGIAFINSDPDMVAVFLHFFRTTFSLDESRFRALLHLHEYHSAQKQVRFWSDITGLSKKQFIKPYVKHNTGKNIREGYPGCISIRYYDSNIAKELRAIAKGLFKNYSST